MLNNFTAFGAIAASQVEHLCGLGVPPQGLRLNAFTGFTAFVFHGRSVSAARNAFVTSALPTLSAPSERWRHLGKGVRGNR